MQKSILELNTMGDNRYQAVFKNNHGRHIYLQVSIEDNSCCIAKCFYIDRRNRPEPTLLETRDLSLDNLLSVVEKELDKSFDSYRFNTPSVKTMEAFIETTLRKEKDNVLIMLKDGNILKTIFKNRYRRAIFIEIDISGEKALVKTCRYCDARANGTKMTPRNLTTIYFVLSLENILDVINNELEGGFTDIVVTEEHTITLDHVICGAI